MRLRRGCLASISLSLGLLVGAALPLPDQAQANSGGVAKVLIIMEENHGTSEAVAGMPYLMGLANSPGGA
jgi:hypothetical protein